ncbi:MAG: M16 family metallopeptidase [Bacilli bacterium]
MVRKTVCKNGVRIVCEPITSVRSVAVGIWIAAGSRNESKERNGISHFLEHMFFKGTQTRSAKEIAESFDRIGGQVNAFTAKEYTCYYAKVLDNHTAYAVETLADMFFNSVFSATEVDRERGVIAEEINMYEDEPDDSVHDQLSVAAYGDHPLSRPILGTKESIATFSGDSFRSYMNDYYAPERVVISIAGNYDESVIETIQNLFGHYTTNGTTEPLEQPSFVGSELCREKQTEQAHVCIAYPGLYAGHTDSFAVSVVNNIFGGSMSSRLFQEVREQRGLAYSVYSYHNVHKDSGLFTIYAGTSPTQLPVLLETVQSTVETFRKEGISDTELKNTKEQLKGNLMLGLESTNSRMIRNGKNELVLGYHRSLDELITLIDEVGLADVKRVTDAIFGAQSAYALIGPTYGKYNG